MGVDDITRIEAALTQLIRLVGSRRVHEARARANGVDISRTSLRVLTHVDEVGPMPVSRIAALLDTSQPTASRTLQQLERDGLVAPVSDPADARVVMYAVTAAGHRLREQFRRQMHAQLAEALAGLHGAQRVGLADGLTEFVTRLQDVEPAGGAGTARVPRRPRQGVRAASPNR